MPSTFPLGGQRSRCPERTVLRVFFSFVAALWSIFAHSATTPPLRAPSPSVADYGVFISHLAPSSPGPFFFASHVYAATSFSDSLGLKNLTYDSRHRTSTPRRPVCKTLPAPTAPCSCPTGLSFFLRNFLAPTLLNYGQLGIEVRSRPPPL